MAHWWERSPPTHSKRTEKDAKILLSLPGNFNENIAPLLTCISFHLKKRGNKNEKKWEEWEREKLMGQYDLLTPKIRKRCFLCIPELQKLIFRIWNRRPRSAQVFGKWIGESSALQFRAVESSSSSFVLSSPYFLLQWGTRVLRHFHKMAPFWTVDIPTPSLCVPPPPSP